MPVAVTYPGVYIEEIPSGVRSITGVATSIAAFVDAFSAGPMNKAVRVLGFADFEKQFGGLAPHSEASYALSQFFLNGGSEAYVVRVTSTTAKNGALKAAVVLEDSASAGVLIASAIDEGAWGNNVLVGVDYDTTDPTTLFNLTVTELATVNGVTTIAATETFRNLVVDPTQPNDAAAVVNASSQLIRLAETGSTKRRPALTGTASQTIAGGAFTVTAGQTMSVALNKDAAVATAGLATVPTTLSQLASALQALIRGVQSGGKPVAPNATVTVMGSAAGNAQLVATAGTANPADSLALSDGGTGLATALGFDKASPNVQQYALGGAPAGAQGGAASGGKAQPGSDGTWDPVNDGAGITGGLLGDQNAKSGLYALLDVDLFNILCIPATMNLPDTDAAQVASQAEALCTARRAMYILDVPNTANAASRDTVDGVMSWLDANSGLRSRNAALYFPRVDIADPLNGFRLRAVAPSGTVAGVWASTDAARGVWKAPAGISATLAGVQKLEYKLTDLENGVLNPLAINAQRTF
ncbi:MAG TPA: hypothetical protein VGT98_02965, partial [Candidatus Elarobacter sp.]|nr:hypothetical protein [Candidatus Elarobacter sp.]